MMPSRKIRKIREWLLQPITPRQWVRDWQWKRTMRAAAARAGIPVEESVVEREPVREVERGEDYIYVPHGTTVGILIVRKSHFFDVVVLTKGHHYRLMSVSREDLCRSMVGHIGLPCTFCDWNGERGRLE